MTQDPPVRPAARRLPWWALVPLSAAAWWVVGFLPWIVQSTWRPALPSSGAWLAVPLLTSSLGALLGGALLGGLVAALLGRAAGRERPWRAVAASAAGIGLALAVTLGQSGGAVRDAGGFDGDSRVIAGLGALVVLGAGVGWAVGSCWALGRTGLGVGLVVLGAALPGWVNGMQFAVLELVSDPQYGYPSIDDWWALIAGAAVTSAGLAVIGVRPPALLAWWPPALLAAWFVGPALTAAVYIEVYLRSGAGLPGSLPEAVAATRQVFGEASLPANRVLWPWLAAVAAGLVLAVVRPRLRSSTPGESPAEEPAGVPG